jgi:hypothetical protein
MNSPSLEWNIEVLLHAGIGTACADCLMRSSLVSIHAPRRWTHLDAGMKDRSTLHARYRLMWDIHSTKMICSNQSKGSFQNLRCFNHITSYIASRISCSFNKLLATLHVAAIINHQSSIPWHVWFEDKWIWSMRVSVYAPILSVNHSFLTSMMIWDILTVMPVRLILIVTSTEYLQPS